MTKIAPNKIEKIKNNFLVSQTIENSTMNLNYVNDPLTSNLTREM